MYIEKLVEAFDSWEGSTELAIIENENELTYSKMHSLILQKASKVSNRDSIIFVHEQQGISFVIDLFSILLSGNIPMLIPSYFDEVELENVIKKTNAQELNIGTIEECHKISSKSDSDIAIIIFSSGTTGSEKMIPITFESLYHRIMLTEKYFGRENRKSELAVLSFYSALGLQHQLFPCLYKKCTIVVMQGLFNPRRIIKCINKYKISYLALVPTLVRYIYEYSSKQGEALESVKKILIAGEKANSQLLKSVVSHYKHIDVYQAYGMSEGLPVAMYNYKSENDIKEDFVGTIIDEVDVKIKNKDENGHGEIVVSGANIIDGYYFDDAANAYINTGDIGRIGKNKSLYIVGRKKNIVIVNGKKIYPEKIEKVAETYPIVLEAKAYGVKDSIRGESISLKVVLKDENSEMDIVEFRRFLGLNLNAHYCPLEIKVVDKIDMTHNFKKKR